MRYSETIYKKVFPTVKEKPVVESAVDTFKPTEEPVAPEEDVAVESVDAAETEEEEVVYGNDADTNGIDN